VAVEVWRLDSLGTTVAVNAQALGATSHTLDSLSGLPLVGGRIRTAAEQIRLAASRTERDALASRSQFHHLAVLLGLAVALVPTLPVAGIYLAVRTGWLARMVALSEREATAESDKDRAA
jgi:hypothetical protein